VTLERMTVGISKSLSLRSRLIEENRLITLWKYTKEKFTLSTEDYSHHVLPDCKVSRIKNTGQKRLRNELISRGREISESKEARLLNSLLRPLTQLESNQVETAMTCSGDLNAPLYSVTLDSGDLNAPLYSVTLQSFRRLRDGEWLNDEVINGYMDLLFKNVLDRNLPKIHFYRTFFFTQLMDQKATNTYTYNNVKRWSRHAPDENIFALNKLFIPINIERNHWFCVVVNFEKKIIQCYDSIRGRGRMTEMIYILQYLQDEWRSKNPDNHDLPQMSDWNLIDTTNDTPQQENDRDCGIFTCMFMLHLSMGYDLCFNQADITAYGRKNIAISILKRVLCSR